MRAEARKAYDLIEPGRRWQLVTVLGTMIVTALLQTLGVVSVMPFISLVADPGIVQRNAWMARVYDWMGFESTRGFLIAVGFGVILFLAASNAFSAFSRWISVRFVWDLHHRLSQRLLEKYLRSSYSFYLNRNTAELSKNLLGEIRNVVDLVVMPFVDILARGVTVLFLVALLVIVDPLLAVAAAGVLGGGYVFVYVLLRRKQGELGLQRHKAFGERFQIAGEAFGGIKDVKVLEKEELYLSRFERASGRFSDASTKQSVMSELPRYALETIAFSGVIATIIYLLETRESLNEVLPVVALYALAGYRLMPALQTVFVAVAHIRFHAPVLDSVHHDLFDSSEQRTRIPDAAVPESGADSSAAPLSFERKIEFRDVDFRYPAATDLTLRGVNLTIPVNRTIGLVGTTGSGKTTIVDLLLGLFQPTRGEILVDGVALGDDNLSAWKRSIGYVSQSIFLTDSTIAQNIAFGVPKDRIDMAAVGRAARAAHLDHFIDRLPQGYETIVGERGVRMSGGERQRIAIARALYRDPQVLVLDEATSALDGATEEAVMQAIQDLSGQKTIVLIAHRLTTVRECDTIFLIDRGEVAASGSYSDLSARNPAFRAMAKEAATLG